MDSKPLVGINADFRNAQQDAPAFSYVCAGYYDCITAVGGIPVILPPLEDDSDIAPILDRLDVRIDPRWAVAGAGDEAVVAGWIRFADERPVDTMALMLFADAFPPSVFSMLGTIGWVPTLELTVHLRRRPAPGWIRARFVTDDLTNGMLIESGELWDSSGQLVAKSRQLALLLS